MELDDFNKLDLSHLQALVRQHGQKTCVFWLNGTRRWMLVEQLKRGSEAVDASQFYVHVAAEQIIRILRLLYAAGIHTVIIPAIKLSNLDRGLDYVDNYFLQLVDVLAESAEFRALLEAFDVRARYYGEMELVIATERTERFRKSAQTVQDYTAKHTGARLFFGFCVTDSANAGLIAIKRMGEGVEIDSLTRKDIVTAYYGDWIENIHFSIGYGRMSVHSTPFLMRGTSLYFTLAPSFYFDEAALRAILYDHLYARKIDDIDYSSFDRDAWLQLDAFYKSNAHKVLGVGQQGGGGRLWNPVPLT